MVPALDPRWPYATHGHRLACPWRGRRLWVGSFAFIVTAVTGHVGGASCSPGPFAFLCYYASIGWICQEIRPGPAGALPLGMTLAIGWVPCTGPVLAGILTLATSNGSASKGAALLATYSLGLGLPFIGLAVAASRLQPIVNWLRRHPLPSSWSILPW